MMKYAGEPESDRSPSMYGTKLKPTCGTDLGTKWEKEARMAEGDMEEMVERERTEMKLTLWATAALLQPWPHTGTSGGNSFLALSPTWGKGTKQNNV